MTAVPDVATKGTIIRHGKERTFRVNCWMKAIPRHMPEGGDITDEIIREIIIEEHPDWQYEYQLVYCRREEATHITTNSQIIALDDPGATFTHEYIEWSDETIQQHRNTANWYAETHENDPFQFAPHTIVKRIFGQWVK